jgi:hypothetical protein
MRAAEQVATLAKAVEDAKTQALAAEKKLDARNEEIRQAQIKNSQLLQELVDLLAKTNALKASLKKKGINPEQR